MALEIAQALGHTSSDRAPGRHPETIRARRRWALLPRAGADARRSAGFERILRLAALAFPMAQDAVDHPRLCKFIDFDCLLRYITSFCKDIPLKAQPVTDLNPALVLRRASL